MAITKKVTIEKMVFGGDGMGHLEDGRAIFVPFTLPGEVVEVEIIDDKRRFARGKLVKIITPSQKRIQPRCRHFGECGGCHYQMLSYLDQLAVKEAILIEQFNRIANIDLSGKITVVGSPDEWNYRQTIQLHTSDLGLGYLRANSNVVVPVTECYLPFGEFNGLLNILSFEEETDITSIQIRWGDDEDMLFVLEGEGMEMPELEVEIPASVIYRNGGEETVLAGEDFQIISIAGNPLVVSANSFFQASSTMAEKMVEYLVEQLKPGTSDLLLDLYCGIGLFSRFFAEKGSACIGIEFGESAVADYAQNLDPFDDIQIYEGMVEDILPDIDSKPTICIVDPPRSGLEATVVDQLGMLNISRLAYVSCDPATLARDIGRLLEKGYSLIGTALFDQFPQTYHMETICILRWENTK